MPLQSELRWYAYLSGVSPPNPSMTPRQVATRGAKRGAQHSEAEPSRLESEVRLAAGRKPRRARRFIMSVMLFWTAAHELVVPHSPLGLPSATGQPQAQLRNLPDEPMKQTDKLYDWMQFLGAAEAGRGLEAAAAAAARWRGGCSGDPGAPGAGKRRPKGALQCLSSLLAIAACRNIGT